MLASLGAFSTTVKNIASYFSVPTIGNLYYKKTGPIGSVNALEQIKRLMDLFQIGIPVYPDKYEKRGGNEIGQQVLVGGIGTDTSEGIGVNTDVTGALVKVADNIVVSPRIWVIHGYTGLNLENGGIVSSALGMAGQFVGTSGLNLIPQVAGALSTFVQKFGRETFNNVMTKALEYISSARRPFKFTTAEGETVPAIIKSYAVKKAAENLNWVELDLEIQEFRYIALTQGSEQVSAGGVNGIYASGQDAIKQCGRTLLKSIAL